MTTPSLNPSKIAQNLIGLPPTATYTLLRLPAVLKARGRSRSSHYTDIKHGLFTRQVNLGVHCVGWPEHEVIALNEARIAGMADREIRALVQHLEARRKGGA